MRHLRPFLVRLPQHPRLRLMALSARSLARELFQRHGTDAPLTIHDREARQTSEWWTAEGSAEPTPLYRCRRCNSPIRPTGAQGRPRRSCEACR